MQPETHENGNGEQVAHAGASNLNEYLSVLHHDREALAYGEDYIGAEDHLTRISGIKQDAEYRICRQLDTKHDQEKDDVEEMHKDEFEGFTA